jgi:hypothetical protein
MVVTRFKSKIPGVDYLGVKPAAVPSLPGAQWHVLRTGNEVKLTLPASLPAAEHWLQVLSGSELNWLHAVVGSEFVAQGTSYIANPLRRVLVLLIYTVLIRKLCLDYSSGSFASGGTRSDQPERILMNGGLGSSVQTATATSQFPDDRHHRDNNEFMCPKAPNKGTIESLTNIPDGF